MKLSLLSNVNTNIGWDVWVATLLFALVACQAIPPVTETTATPSGVDDPYPALATPPLPTPDDRPLTPTATLPGRSNITLSAPTQLVLPSEIQKISFTELLGENLVGQAVTDAGVQVALVNVATGQTKLLSDPVAEGAIYPQLTKDAVAWLEPNGADLYKVQVYSLETGQTTTPLTMHYLQRYDFDADTLIYSDLRNKEWGLYAYQISTTTETKISSENLGCVKVSYPWVTYEIVDYTEDHQPKPVSKLRAYNLKTWETLALGEVYTPNSGEPCDFYKLDANDVVWLIHNPFDPENPHSEIHAYDLARRTEQVIAQPKDPSGFPALHVLVSQHLLVLGTLGADLTDLTQGMSFYVSTKATSGQGLAIPWFFSEGRLVWGIMQVNKPTQFYTATLIR